MKINPITRPKWIVARQVHYSLSGRYERTEWYALNIQTGQKGNMRDSYDSAVKDIPEKERDHRAIS